MLNVNYYQIVDGMGKYDYERTYDKDISDATSVFCMYRSHINQQNQYQYNT